MTANSAVMIADNPTERDRQLGRPAGPAEIECDAILVDQAVEHVGDKLWPGVDPDRLGCAAHQRQTVEIGGSTIPFWVSWLALFASGALAYLGFTPKR